MIDSLAIHIAGLRKIYGSGHLALAGVDLDVHAGEFFGLLGPNGAGKSSLINILAGTVRRSSGVAEIFGFDVEQDFRRSRRLLGVVPQELAYDPFFTVREFLHMQSGYFGLRHNEDWLDELMAELDAADSATLAVLLEWTQQAAGRGVPLRIHGASPKLRELASLYSLQDILPLCHD